MTQVGRREVMTQNQTYTVTGMTCGHCVSSVTEELRELAGVQDVSVVLETGAVTVVSSDGIDESAVKAAVEEAGYQLA
jgi:copper chaperone CopZ